MIGDIDTIVLGAFGLFGVRPYRNARGEYRLQVSRGTVSVDYTYLEPDAAREMADALYKVAKEVERLRATDERTDGS